MVFVVSLSALSTVDVTFNFTTHDGAGNDGAAKSPEDYSGGSQVLTISAGQLQHVVAVPINDDPATDDPAKGKQEPQTQFSNKYQTRFHSGEMRLNMAAFYQGPE